MFRKILFYATFFVVIGNCLVAMKKTSSKNCPMEPCDKNAQQYNTDGTNKSDTNNQHQCSNECKAHDREEYPRMPTQRQTVCNCHNAITSYFHPFPGLFDMYMQRPSYTLMGQEIPHKSYPINFLRTGLHKTNSPNSFEVNHFRKLLMIYGRPFLPQAVILSAENNNYPALSQPLTRNNIDPLQQFYANSYIPPAMGYGAVLPIIPNTFSGAGNSYHHDRKFSPQNKPLLSKKQFLTPAVNLDSVSKSLAPPYSVYSNPIYPTIGRN